jgi:hypothetical protein
MFKYIIPLLLLCSISEAQTFTKGNNLYEVPVSIATAASTTTLTCLSDKNEQFTGSTTQSVVLPAATASGCLVGRTFYISNRSTGTITIKYNDSSTALTLLGGNQAYFILEANGTSNGTWDIGGTQAPLAMGTVGSSPNANAGVISAGVLTLEPADATHPGVFTAIAQALGGNKTLTGNLNITPTGTTDVILTLNQMTSGTGNAFEYYDQFGARQAYLTAAGSFYTNAYVQPGGLRMNGLTYPNTIYNSGNPISITTTAGNGIAIDTSGNTVTTGTATVGTSIILAGSSSGTVGFSAPAAAGSTLYTLPAADGSANQCLATNASHVLSWITPAGTGITALTGGVTASGSGSVTATVVTNANLTGPITSVGNATSIASQTGTGTTFVMNTAPTMTNPVVGTQLSSDNSTKAASTAYVQTALAQLNPAAAVVAASTANVAGTYTNAVSGVCIGDTFTTTATTAFALDGQSPAVGARVLLKNQTSTFQDGIWVLTTQAVGSVSGAILTRALDFDSSADINAGSIVPVVSGTVNAGSSWYQTATVTTCNTDAQTWIQFQAASSSYLLAANNLSDVATKATAFNNISPMTTGGDIIYGGASGAGARLANGSSGQVLTSAGGTSAPTWSSAPAPVGVVARNYLINGGFDLWQRGTSFTASGATSVQGQTADRWVSSGVGATSVVTTTQTAGVVAGSRFGAQVKITTAPGSFGSFGPFFAQFAENIVSIQSLYNTPISGSAYVKALGNTNQVSISAAYNTSLSSSLANASAISLITCAVNTSTFTLCSFTNQTTSTSPTTSGVVGLEIVGSGASSGHVTDLNNGFIVEQAMLNTGTTAATFVRAGANFEDEVHMAQRFYEKTFDLTVNPGTSTDNGAITFTVNGLTSTSGRTEENTWDYKVTKLQNGTVTTYDGAGASGKVTTEAGNGITSGTEHQGTNSVSIYTNPNTGTAASMALKFHATCDAEF